MKRAKSIMPPIRLTSVPSRMSVPRLRRKLESTPRLARTICDEAVDHEDVEEQMKYGRYSGPVAGAHPQYVLFTPVMNIEEPARLMSS